MTDGHGSARRARAWFLDGDQPSSERGFSLIEVLMAVVILGMTSTTMMGAIFATERSSQLQRASALADAEMRRFADWVQQRDYTPCADPMGMVSTRTAQGFYVGGTTNALIASGDLQAADVGLRVSAPGLPPKAYIGTVVNPYIFYLSSSPTSQVDLIAPGSGNTNVYFTIYARDYRGFTASSSAFKAEIEGIRFANQELGDGVFTENGTDSFAGTISFGERGATSCASGSDPGAQELRLKVTYTEGGEAFPRSVSVVKRSLN